ncbi:MAG: alpha-amylase family glycosyl hydrolase [Candidatus Paceibacterota bacterium]|jgi:maltose alpha-D-glucosyltransferase/alpha-amylase
MKNSKWWSNAVFYELYVDKFAGDFRGLSEKLDYLEKLGVSCLHILPHYPSPMIDDGYDISDYRNVQKELGTLDDFRSFVEEAHKKGIRILTDFVLNHISAEHPWFIDARSSKESKYRNYFLWSDTGEELKESTNVFFHIKPKNWIKNEATNDYYFTTFYAEQPDLNWNEPKVMEEMLAIMDFWIDLGVDAFRLDAAPHLIKKEGTNSNGLPETHAVLKKIRAHLDEKYPDIALLGEVHDTPERTREYFGTGDECHMVYHFPLAIKTILAAKRNDNHIVDEIIASMGGIPDGCGWVTFLRNHDALVFPILTPEEKAEILEYGDPTGKYRFRTDRGIAVRLATLFEKEPEKIRNAFSLLFREPGSPVIYYGEEIGMKNDTTIGEQKDTRRYVRGVFDWETATIQTKDADSLFSFIAKEIQTKKAGE